MAIAVNKLGVLFAEQELVIKRVAQGIRLEIALVPSLECILVIP